MGPEERKTLELVCRQAALALMNANRYEKARTWARKSNRAGIGQLIGTSDSMQAVFELINQVALSPSTSVLITGPSGTGKELVARAIHDLSSRANEPFVALNCAAIPAALLESELFGHEKGAFTDAKTRRIGLIEQADKGTLLLDEISEMAPPLQSKMLRILEERQFKRLGGAKDIQIDIRVIASTNIDIEQAVSLGEFREDLFYRLNVFPISLPPLRDRGEDVVLIANEFIRQLNERLGRRITAIDPGGSVSVAFRSYEWPGNVRELRNVLERAMILCRGNALNVKDLPSPIGTPDHTMTISEGAVPADAHGTQHEGTLVTLKELEAAHIERVLGAVKGDKKLAAGILGINPATLYRKLKR